jgi:excisionase family DNA binding protein
MEKESLTIFTMDDLAQYFQVTKSWVYNHIHELPHYKLGGRLLRFRKEAIDRWLETQKVEPIDIKKTMYSILKPRYDSSHQSGQGLRKGGRNNNEPQEKQQGDFHS